MVHTHSDGASHVIDGQPWRQCVAGALLYSGGPALEHSWSQAIQRVFASKLELKAISSTAGAAAMQVGVEMAWHACMLAYHAMLV